MNNTAEERGRHLVLEANKEEVRRNKEWAMKNAAEEKSRCLVLEAELQEMKEILNVWGNT
jgi:hypothetical protein